MQSTGVDAGVAWWSNRAGNRCGGRRRGTGRAAAGPRPARYGSVIGLRAEQLDEYKKLHAAVWPEVAKAIREGNIRNYSIYLRKLPDGQYYLFSYFEYVGQDFKADMDEVFHQD